MKILTYTSFFYLENKYFFIRIDPENISTTIQDILKELGSLSWLSKIRKSFLQESFLINANKTIEALKLKFDNTADDSSIKRECGEYIVSTLSKKSVVTILNHTDIPLMELLGLKKTHNPGFDFYTEKKDNYMLYCGEAKYVASSSAHSSCMNQINDFINQSKHKSDLVLIDNFIEEETGNNTIADIIGVIVAFSCLKQQTDNYLIEKIKNNQKFIELIGKSKSIIFVGVEF